MSETKKFKALIRSIRKQYLNKKVPVKYRKKYGKVYSKDEVKSIAYAIAKKQGWRV